MLIKRNHWKQNHATSLRHSILILQVELGPAPLLWEIGNNALRPIVYFMTNPAVWDGFAKLFCRKNTTMVSMITMRKLKCLWLLSPQSKLYYQPNPKWESKNRHLFFFKEERLMIC